MFRLMMMTLTMMMMMMMLVAPAFATTADLDADEDGYTAYEGDCNDGRSDTYPGAAEVCGDGVDNNCNGAIDGLDRECQTYLPQGTICGMGHAPHVPETTCDGAVVTDLGGCPLPYEFFTLKDVVPQSDFMFVFGCRLPVGEWVGERPEGTVIAYGHSQNMPSVPVRDTWVTWADQQCPAGSSFFALNDRGGDANSFYFGCALSAAEPVTHDNRDDMVGMPCGLSHTVSGAVLLGMGGNYACDGMFPDWNNPNSCPPDMELAQYGDRGGDPSTGEFACRYSTRPNLD